MATGMVLVIVARHIDLSVGSVLGFVGMAMAVLEVEVLPLGTSWNWLLSLVLGLALGAAIGAFQGWWVAYRAVPAFIVTLGGLPDLPGSGVVDHGGTHGRSDGPELPASGRRPGWFDR